VLNFECLGSKVQRFKGSKWQSLKGAKLGSSEVGIVGIRHWRFFVVKQGEFLLFSFQRVQRSGSDVKMNCSFSE